MTARRKAAWTKKRLEAAINQWRRDQGSDRMMGGKLVFSRAKCEGGLYLVVEWER